jgi:hypothetical protein
MTMMEMRETDGSDRTCEVLGYFTNSEGIDLLMMTSAGVWFFFFSSILSERHGTYLIFLNTKKRLLDFVSFLVMMSFLWGF